MITPILEKMLITGEAQHIVVPMSSESAYFKLPEKTIGIIHNIQTGTFADPRATLRQNKPEDINNTVLHQLRIYSKRGQQHFIQRSHIKFNIDDLSDPDPISQLVEWGYYNIDTFLVHEGNIGVQWVHNPLLANWTFQQNIQPNIIQDQPVPIGYGNIADPGAIPTSDAWEYNDTKGYAYRPRSQAGLMKQPNPEFGQFIFPTESPDTLLNLPNVGEQRGYGIYTFPITHLQIVQINQDKLTNILSSL